ncbi:TPA: RusA family crossover junction endodeoxyribonuclease [Vibrio harveyi]|nr:RusA family crossover junction endodeoxyribonuclease [Vibrio harveyi]
MSTYDFALPFPLTVNACYRSVHGRSILSKKARNYRKEVREKMIELGLDNLMIEKRVAVRLELFPSTKRKFDIDNYCKSLFDALTHCRFWCDDHQIDVMLVIKRRKIIGGLAKIRVLTH